MKLLQLHGLDKLLNYVIYRVMWLFSSLFLHITDLGIPNKKCFGA